MRPMRWAGAVAIWAACVALVAGAAWYAIDSAGRQVSLLSGGAPAGATGDDSVVVRPAPAPTDATTPAPDPTLGPATSTERPTSGPSRTTRTTDDEPGDDDPSREPSTRTSTKTGTSRPDPSVTVRSRTVSTRGGTVTLTCSSSGEIDFAARPAQGWSAHGERSGTGEVEVELERGVQKVEVHGHCVGGVPRVEVEDHDEKEDDD